MTTKNKKLGFFKRNQSIIGFLIFGTSLSVGFLKVILFLLQNQSLFESFGFIINMPNWFLGLLFIFGLIIGIGGLGNE